MGRRCHYACTGPVLALLLAVPRPTVAAWPIDPRVNVAVCAVDGSPGDLLSVADGAGGVIVIWEDFKGSHAQHLLASGVVDPAWPAGGLPLHIYPESIVSDAAGGAIIAGGFGDVFAQHVLASGVVDPAWPADGQALCTARNSQRWPVIVADGKGGAIVAWEDDRHCNIPIGPRHDAHSLRRNHNYDIYAQHVQSDGALDAAWPVDGRAVCMADSNQKSPAIVSDGAGGALITWQDFRRTAMERIGPQRRIVTASGADIYVQHVLASGAADSTWPDQGRALCTVEHGGSGPKLVADGAGGAIIAWTDYRSATAPLFDEGDIHAQHVLASGALDPAWPADGRSLCATARDQKAPELVTDGAQGAIVAWGGDRNDAPMVLQHVPISGVPDPAWPTGGFGLRGHRSGSSRLFHAPGDPVIVSDGMGGAVVGWLDQRGSGGAGRGWSGIENDDLYGQHVLASGVIDPAWPAMGRAVCTARHEQKYPVSVSDGAGGAVVVWYDNRDSKRGILGASDDKWVIYAQRVTANGQLGDPGSVPREESH